MLAERRAYAYAQAQADAQGVGALVVVGPFGRTQSPSPRPHTSKADAMANADRPSPSDRTPTPLRVFRCEPGCAWKVWTLSPKIGGLIVHYYKGRSEYCDPRGCPAPQHAAPWNWKGYVAACLWDEPAALWRPIVLELTSNAELDMRGLYAKGQLWELRRDPERSKKKKPVTATLLDAKWNDGERDAFPIMDVLRHLYHKDVIDLTAPNPLPPRTLVEPFAGRAPVDPNAPPADKPLTAEEFQKFRAKMGLPPKGEEGGGPSPRRS
jgi:hypothetical protein